MALSIYNLLKSILLLANALAILHPDRFLRKYNMDGRPGPAGEMPTGIKQQVSGFITATRYMRLPLIICNIIVVVIELLIG